MKLQSLFNLALLGLLTVLAVDTASIARSLRSVERMEHHRVIEWRLIRPPQVTIATTGTTATSMSVTSTPLFQWQVLGTFPTYDDCEAERSHYAFLAAYDAESGPPQAWTSVRGKLAVALLARCFPADDPRLRRNW